MMQYILTLLILLQVVSADDPYYKKPGTPGKPHSVMGDGYDATQIFLKRSDLQSGSRDGTRGHFYATFRVGALQYNAQATEEYDMQFSTFTPFTTIISSDCPDTNCNVPKKFKIDNSKTQYTKISKTGVKNMDAATETKKHQGGFKFTYMDGYTIDEGLIYMNKWDETKHLDLEKMPFVIVNKLHDVSKDDTYASNQSGVIGLGMPSIFGDISIVQKWRADADISKNIVSFNITFRPESWQAIEDSYIQLGPVDQYTVRNASWINTIDFNYWRSDVSLSYFRKGDDQFPFIEYQAKAIFDPSVDYLYVNSLEFVNLITPVLKTMYGDDIGCTETDCYFVRSCDAVRTQYKHSSLNFNLGPKDKLNDQVEITVDLEKYLVKGSELGLTDDKCFIPIFVVNPGQSTYAFNTWYLGNMFLDRYFVMHDYESSNQNLKINPRIGIYDKWDPFNGAWTPPEQNDNTNGGDPNAGNDVPVKPIIIPGETEEESSGASTFWAIFLTLFFLGLGALLIKFFGKQCLEKINEMRGGGAQFKTGEYDVGDESNYEGEVGAGMLTSQKYAQDTV